MLSDIEDSEVLTERLGDQARREARWGLIVHRDAIFRFEVERAASDVRLAKLRSAGGAPGQEPALS